MDSDYPIESCSDDVLGRSTVARRIAGQLMSAPTNHSTVFGLCGPWGSGKTSLLNMVREELQKDKSHPIVINFNPWLYIPSDNLVVPFLALLSEEIQRSAKGAIIVKAAKKVTRVIRRYSDVLSSAADAFEWVPGVSVAQAVFRRWGKEKTVSPSVLKDRISGQLKDAGMRVVVLIDDLDRLSNEAIRSVFQLVAAVADFPGVNYLIAYDLNNVVKALEAVQGCDGEQYLEKIVQVPLELHEPSYGSLTELCEESVNELLGGMTINDTEATEVGRCLGLVVERIGTVRDARRLFNVYEVELAEAGDKVSPADVLAMTALRLFTPKLMPWLSSHRFLLEGGMHAGFSSAKAAEERKDDCQREILERLDGDESAAGFAYRLLCLMFPQLRFYCGEPVADVSEEMLRIHRRIACPEILDYYLSGMLDAYDFPREEAARLVRSGTAEELEELFSQGANGIATTVMVVSAELAAELGPVQVENVARALLRAGVGKGRLLQRPLGVLDNAFERLLGALGKDAAGKLLLGETQGLDFSGYAALAPFTRKQQLAHAKMTGGRGLSGNPLVTLECLAQLERNIVSALNKATIKASDLTIDGAQTLLYIWREIDKEGYAHHVTNGILQDPLGHAIYESYRLGRYASSPGGCGYTFPNGIPEDVDYAEAASCVTGLLRSEEFWQLPAEWQQCVTALGICAEKVARGADYVDVTASEEEVRDRLGLQSKRLISNAGAAEVFG